MVKDTVMIKLSKLRPRSRQIGDSRLVKAFDALGDETRFKIMRLLSTRRDICVSELAEAVGISTPGVSQQLKVLEAGGLVYKERMGQKICYRLRRDDPLVAQVMNLFSKV